MLGLIRVNSMLAPPVALSYDKKAREKRKIYQKINVVEVLS